MYIVPLKNKHRVTSPFGWRKDPVTKKNKKHHNGVDLVTGKRDEPVLAFANGRVIKALKSTHPSGGFGYYVVIRHWLDGKFYTSLYAHMKPGSFKVKVGEKVTAGQQIGIMGTSGYSTGVHLHFEIWKGRTHGWSADGKGFADPLKFIEAMNLAADAKKDIEKPTPESAKTNPIPKHENKPAARKPASPGKTASTSKPTAKKPVVEKPEPKVVKPATSPTPKTHKVVRGDSYWSIAEKYKLDFEKLQKLNSNKPLRPGELVRLDPGKVDTEPKRMYTVKAGDSYWKIGKQFNVDYRKIQRLNSNKPLVPGDIINLN